MTGAEPAGRVVYEFQGLRLDPARRLLSRIDDGTSIAITGKPFDALLYLVTHAGQLVTRRELADALWPSTVVEDNNLSQTVVALRRALGDTLETPRFIATVPRRGYQFVTPVRTVPAADATGILASSPGRRRLRPIGVVAGLALIALLVGWYAWTTMRTGSSAESVSPASESRTAARIPSIAVLPFANLSPRPEHAYFAAGMHEELLSQLARLRGLEVKGRTSVLAYGDATPLETIVRELDVATVLEGSVRYDDRRVRVAVRLIEGRSGSELWSETYDAALDDVFEIQAEIAGRVAAQLATRLSASERSQIAAPPTHSLEAYSHYLQALSQYRARGGIGVGMPRAVREDILHRLDAALQLDPRFAAALGWRAHIRIDSLLFDPIRADEHARIVRTSIDRIEADARGALAIDSSLAIARVAMARLDMLRWRLRDAARQLSEAHALVPSDPVVLHYTAMIRSLLGEYPAAVQAAQRALELDPQNPAPHTPLVLSQSAMGDRRSAAEAARRMIEVAPGAPLGYIHLARVLTGTPDVQGLREALRLAEPLLDPAARNLRLDMALCHAAAGDREDAARAMQRFGQSIQDLHVSPGLQAMALIAAGDYSKARSVLERVIANRPEGTDPVPLLLIRINVWSHPVLEEPAWRAMRDRLVLGDGRIVQ